MKPIAVTHRKLGKHKAIGLAYKDEHLIEVDERLKGFDHLQTVIHEILHVQNPRWPEIKVEGHSTQIAEILWNLNYKRTT